MTRAIRRASLTQGCLVRPHIGGLDGGRVYWAKQSRMRAGCEKMGTVPSAGRISPIESANVGGAKWTGPDFFTAPLLARLCSVTYARNGEGHPILGAAIVN